MVFQTAVVTHNYFLRIIFVALSSLYIFILPREYIKTRIKKIYKKTENCNWYNIKAKMYLNVYTILWAESEYILKIYCFTLPYEASLLSPQNS